MSPDTAVHGYVRKVALPEAQALHAAQHSRVQTHMPVCRVTRPPPPAHLLRHASLLVAVCEDDGAVLRPYVVALAVGRGGVVQREEDLGRGGGGRRGGAEGGSGTGAGAGIGKGNGVRCRGRRPHRAAWAKGCAASKQRRTTHIRTHLQDVAI